MDVVVGELAEKGQRAIEVFASERETHFSIRMMLFRFLFKAARNQVPWHLETADYLQE